MWTCENCKHLNTDESRVCERCGMPKVDSEHRRVQRESEEEMEQIESDMWDEDQGLM
jgi:rRNA maturation endonuclease Nob1